MYKQILTAAPQMKFPEVFPPKYCVVALNVNQIIKLMCFDSQQSTASEPRVLTHVFDYSCVALERCNEYWVIPAWNLSQMGKKFGYVHIKHNFGG